MEVVPYGLDAYVEDLLVVLLFLLGQVLLNGREVGLLLTVAFLVAVELLRLDSIAAD